MTNLPSNIVDTIRQYIVPTKGTDISVVEVMRHNCSRNIPLYFDSVKRYKALKASAERELAQGKEAKAKEYLERAEAVKEIMIEEKALLLSKVQQVLSDALPKSRELILKHLKDGNYEHDIAVAAIYTHPMQSYTESNPDTIKTAISSKSPTLGAMTKYVGNEPTVAFVKAIVSKFIGYYAKSTVTDADKYDIARYVIQKFPQLNIDDLKYMVMSTVGTKSYGEVDVAFIMGMVKAYASQRCIQADDDNYSKHENTIAKMGGRENLYRSSSASKVVEGAQTHDNYSRDDLPQTLSAGAAEMYNQFKAQIETQKQQAHDDKLEAFKKLYQK